MLQNILQYTKLLEYVQSEELAHEVLTSLSVLFKDNAFLFSLSSIENSTTAIKSSQDVLHQLKGILPMLCSDEFISTLRIEEQYLRNNSQFSVNFYHFTNDLKKLEREILAHLVSTP